MKINAIATVKASVRFIDGFFEKIIGAVIVDFIFPSHFSVNKECKLVVLFTNYHYQLFDSFLLYGQDN